MQYTRLATSFALVFTGNTATSIYPTDFFEGSGSVSSCDPNPCRNGGKCKISLVDNFECDCAEHSTGKKCEIFDFSSLPSMTQLESWVQFDLNSEKPGLYPFIENPGANNQNQVFGPNAVQQTPLDHFNPDFLPVRYLEFKEPSINHWKLQDQTWPEAGAPALIFKYAGLEYCLAQELNVPGDLNKLKNKARQLFWYQHVALKFDKCVKRKVMVLSERTKLVVKDRACVTGKSIDKIDCSALKCITVSHLKNETLSDGVYKNRVFAELIDCGRTSSKIESKTLSKASQNFEPASEVVHYQDFKFNSETGRIHLISDLKFCLSVDKTGKSYGFNFTSKNRDRMSVDYCDFGFSQSIQFGRRNDWVAEKKVAKIKEIYHNGTIASRSLQNAKQQNTKFRYRRSKNKKVKDEWDERRGSNRRTKNSATTTVLN